MEAACRELAELYRRVDMEIDALGGECRRCGRCCRLKDGLALYATLLERTYLLRNSPRPEAARLGRSECAYLVDGSCAARPWRSLGCRTYFCDKAATDARQALHERALREISTISERHGIARDYAPVTASLPEDLAREDVKEESRG